jgi:hypothetical protein
MLDVSQEVSKRKASVAVPEQTGKEKLETGKVLPIS